MGSLLEKYGWHEWLCHSNFSFLIGASHPEEYVQRAFDLQYQSLGFVDYDGVYGIVRAYRGLKKIIKDYQLGKTPMKLIYGAELHLASDHECPVIYQDTIVVQALSMRGYFNLCRLLTLAHEGGKRNAHLSFDCFITSDLSDLVLIQPLRGIIRVANRSQIEKRLSTLRDLVPQRFFLAQTRTLCPADDCYLTDMRSLTQKLKIPTLLSQDPFMHVNSRKALSDILQAMRHNQSVDKIGAHLFANGERSLHCLAHIEKIYGALPDFEAGLRNGRELSERFSFELSEIRYRYPQELVPKGLTAGEYLRELTWNNAHKFYQGAVPERISSLLEYELKMINELGFADYFLTVWDIVAWARSQNILCQGRGSAANSSVCFVLGITPVDPTKFDVLFERFISVERGDPPDIDVDFEHERREEVIQYIYQRFGRQRAAMVANVITFKAKGALRYVGKALGLESSLISQISSIISSKQFRGRGMPEVLRYVRDQQDEQTQERVPWVYWARLAEQIFGFPRHMGIHSGGFIVSDQDLNYLSHQEPATMEGRSVIAWSKEDIEALGFFKMDILSLGMLTAVRKSLALIEQVYGHKIQLATLPQDDRATFQMLQRADTVGTFQVESRAQMSMLPRLRPETLYDLVVEVGIVRPGPIQGGFIHPYLKRRRKREKVTYPHPKLKPILERTMGVPIFQEQVMRIAIEVGGFLPGEADELRRQMGAWNLRGDLGPLVHRLAQGMRERGISEKFVQQILQQIKGFAEYGFPESHAVSFAMIAYTSCYLKCHYPAVFTTAMLNSQPLGFYSPHALVQDVRRHGVTVLPICIKNSDWDCHLEKIGGREQYAIRLGLRLVRGLSRKAAEKLIDRRSGKDWRQPKDLLATVQLDRKSLVALASADAFSIFGLSRRSAVWMALASPYVSPLEEEYLFQDFKAEHPLERAEKDFYYGSTTLGPHPVQILRDYNWSYKLDLKKLTPSNELGKRRINSEVFIFGMVLVRQAPPSAKGMVFFTLEDEFGFFNLVFAPDIYQRFAKLIHEHGFICVRGKKQGAEQGHSILVREVYDSRVDLAEVKTLDPGHKKHTSQQDMNNLRQQELKFHPARNYH